jgi:hypothetical protein
MPDYSSITEREVENMLYLISVHAGKREAKRFNALNFEKRQKVTFILKKRAKRARNAPEPIDFFIVREVIDDAKKNEFIFD